MFGSPSAKLPVPFTVWLLPKAPLFAPVTRLLTPKALLPAPDITLLNPTTAEVELLALMTD